MTAETLKLGLTKRRLAVFAGLKSQPPSGVRWLTARDIQDSLCTVAGFAEVN